MKTPSKSLLRSGLLAIAALAISVPLTSQAQLMIGVNNAGGQALANRKMLTADQVIGVDYAQGNWNNLVPAATNASTSGGLERILTPDEGTIVDSTGAATTVGVSYSSVYNWSWNGGTSYTGATEWDSFRQMFQGFIGDNTIGGSDTSFTFTNLNANFTQGYKVYVYVTGAGTGTLTDGLTIYNLAGGVGSIAAMGSEPSWTLAGTEDPIAGANYAVFDNLNLDTLTITISRTEAGSSQNLGISGIQIVAVPEPSTYALVVSAGILAVALKHRRNR